jgi:hypothetical protein
VRLRLGLRNPCLCPCRSRTYIHHLLRHNRTLLRIRSTMALLHHTVLASTSDHTRNLLRRNG